jgi:predicted  nucleic acid-binding Zn-ribbon protein
VCFARAQRAKETTVVLLEHISKGLEREHSMPSQEQAAEMADELQEKKAELEASRFTEEHLQAELARRQAEYKKVTGIDADVTAETRALRGRMTTMTAEMGVFSDMQRVRAAAQATIGDLEGSRDDYKRRRDSAQAQLRSLAAEYQRKKAMLDSHGVEASMVRLESKLRAKEGQAQASKECECRCCWMTRFFVAR